MGDPLHALAAVSLGLATVCSTVIVADLLTGNRQQMWIMNLVWPITVLYAGPLALWAYIRIGRTTSHRRPQENKAHCEEHPGNRRPFWQSVGLAATTADQAALSATSSRNGVSCCFH